MSEEQRDIHPDDGPFLIAAVLCEKVLNEVDGFVSAVRIIDQATRELPPADIPPGAQVLTVPFQAWLLVSFRGGPSGVRHNVTIVGHLPSGIRQPFPAQEIVMASRLEGGIPGSNVIVQLNMGLPTPGTYWFEVQLDGRRVTAVPLRVVFAQPAPQPPG